MSVSFNATRGLIVVPATVEGPIASVKVQLVVDTGASRSLLSHTVLRLAGYNPSLAPTQVPMTSASGQVMVARLSVTQLLAIGHDRVYLSVLAHDLPGRMKADGLLGLDFLRGSVLTIDFQTGLITLN